MLVTSPPVGRRSVVMTVSVSLSVCPFVCLCVCVLSVPSISLELHVRSSHQFFVHITYRRGSVLLWRRCDTLCTSGFMDDVIFAHNVLQRCRLEQSASLVVLPAYTRPRPRQQLGLRAVAESAHRAFHALFMTPDYWYSQRFPSPYRNAR